jgi:hypothetical protein
MIALSAFGIRIVGLEKDCTELEGIRARATVSAFLTVGFFRCPIQHVASAPPPAERSHLLRHRESSQVVPARTDAGRVRFQWGSGPAGLPRVRTGAIPHSADVHPLSVLLSSQFCFEPNFTSDPALGQRARCSSHHRRSKRKGNYIVNFLIALCSQLRSYNLPG